MSRQFKTTDRRRIINWLKYSVSEYEDNMGGVTEFKTPITQELIDGFERRINELEKQEEKVQKRRKELLSQDD